MCSRAKHGDFAFAEYVSLVDIVEKGLVTGKGFKSVQAEFVLLMNSQTAARRAALARSHNVPRLSDEVDGLLKDLGTASQVIALPVAVILIALSLIVAVVA